MAKSKKKAPSATVNYKQVNNLLSRFSRQMNTALNRASSAAAANSQFNANQAFLERNWQERMSNTAHQREVDDLKAAGLNPVLSANAGAPVSAGATASADTGNTAAFANMAAKSVEAVTSLANSILSSKTNLQTTNATNQTNFLNTRTSSQALIKSSEISASATVTAAGIAAEATKYAADRNKQASYFASQMAYKLGMDKAALDAATKRILNDINNKKDWKMLSQKQKNDWIKFGLEKLLFGKVDKFDSAGVSLLNTLANGISHLGAAKVYTGK